jgi:hypothetical protein
MTVFVQLFCHKWQIQLVVLLVMVGNALVIMYGILHVVIMSHWFFDCQIDIQFAKGEVFGCIGQKGDKEGVTYYAVILWFEGHKNKF